MKGGMNSWGGNWGPEITAKGTTTARDFFLWAGALIALYGSVIAFLTLSFSYINDAYPDALASTYSDVYSGPVRAAMAALIVLSPIAVALFVIIRKSIKTDEGKANIWVRRWALVFTLFMTIAVAAVDLITLITTFLGGEITTRFTLKVIIVLLVATFFFMHFLADLKNYWLANPMRARRAGISALIVVVFTILSGFLILGTPHHARLVSYDAQKVEDLRSIQYQIIDSYRTKQVLPVNLGALQDPLNGFSVPSDTQPGNTYEYKVVGAHEFALCATFNLANSQDTTGTGYSGPGTGANEAWAHAAGHKCFSRVIDPAQYPATPVVKTR